MYMYCLLHLHCLGFGVEIWISMFIKSDQMNRQRIAISYRLGAITRRFTNLE